MPTDLYRRARPRSVRGRTAVAAVLVVGIALVVAGGALVLGLRMSLTNYVRTAAKLRAEDVADLVAASERPAALAIDDDEDVFIQVVAADTGAVELASSNVAGEPPLVDLRAGQEARVSGLEFEDDEFLVVAVETETTAGTLTVLAGRNLEVVGESTGTVVRFLLGGLPVLVVVVAVTVWRLAGRALAPVEEIRSEVEGISADGLAQRVPVPPTGDEVARLATTMNAMLQRLETAQSRQRQFVSDAGHELRSPLATIRQHAEVALTHPDKTSTRDLAEVVLAEDLRLDRLVEGLLWLAQADEGAPATRPGSARRRPVDLDDLVLEEVTRLRGTTPLTVDASRLSGGRVVGEPHLLRQLLRNIADNAAHHAHSRVALSLREDGGCVLLGVEDDGPGIPPADRTRVFERFVRLDEARSRDDGGSGLGLGLAIASEIARSHGGLIEVQDSFLGGARFEVNFPTAVDHGAL